MMTYTRNLTTLPLASIGARQIFATRPLDARLPEGGIGSRLAVAKGGFPVTNPPLASPDDVNNHTPCQSPGRGRPH